MSAQRGPLVKSVRARGIRLPMREPHQTASGVITESPLVLIDVTTDDGTVGRGLVFTYTTLALRPVLEFVTNIAGLIEKQSLAPATLADTLQARFRLLGTQGLVGMALAGIDMALWDALARSQNLPLVRLLGALETAVRAYGAVGFDGPIKSAQTAENWARRGIAAVKVKIGYPRVSEDCAVLRAIREAIGPDATIMVDYNQSLSAVDAIERLRRLEEFNLTWVEEPTLAHDYEGHAQIARASPIPIQCGENWWGVMDLQHAIKAGASDFVMLDVMKIGGVTGWLRADAVAGARGLRVSSHLWPEVSAHLLSASPTRHWLEYSDWWNEAVVDPLEIHGGVAVPSDEAGSGLTWNERVVAQYLI